jgi:hypothetical protein
MTATTTTNEVLERLEIEPVNSGACDGDWITHPSGGELASINPADGSVIARVRMAGRDDYERVPRTPPAPSANGA